MTRPTVTAAGAAPADKGRTDSIRRRFVLAAPPLVAVTMYGTFQGLTGPMGLRNGYIASFLVYWLGWCLLVPALILGPRSLPGLFREVHPRLPRPIWLAAGVITIPVLGGFFTAFLPHAGRAEASVFVAVVGIAVVNATLRGPAQRSQQRSGGSVPFRKPCDRARTGLDRMADRLDPVDHGCPRRHRLHGAAGGCVLAWTDVAVIPAALPVRSLYRRTDLSTAHFNEWIQMGVPSNIDRTSGPRFTGSFDPIDSAPHGR